MNNDTKIDASADAVGWDDLEVVLVSYRSRDHVEALLDSWGQQLPVVVVDNSGDVDGLRELADGRPNVRYVDGGGQGFARAANRGAFSSTAPYVAFVNPDSRPTAEDLLALARGVAQDPGAVSHAATVTGHDGDVEIGVGGWEPTLARTATYAFGLHKRFPRHGIYAKPQLGEHIELEWTTGACMVVRGPEFTRLGGFDESFYVYNEDMSFGRRAREEGLTQVLRSDVVVRHGAGGSGAPSVEMLRLRGASFANYVERYHSGVPAKVMRASMATGYALRAAQQKLAGNDDLSRQYRAVIGGLVQRTAHVGGVEVARQRFNDTAPQHGTGSGTESGHDSALIVADDSVTDQAPFLLITKEFGVPATSGGMLRTLALVRWLARRGPVVVVHPKGVHGARLADPTADSMPDSMPDSGIEPEIVIEQLRQAPPRSLAHDAVSAFTYRSLGAPRTCGAGLLTGLRESLDQLGPFRAAIVDHTCVFGVESLLPAQLPVVLSTHNVESDLMRQRADAESGWQHYAALAETRLLRRLEMGVGARRPTVVCTAADGAAVTADTDGNAVVVARNGVTPPSRPLRAEALAAGAINTDELLFTGALDWRPNINGILWLLESDAWKALCQERPNLVLTVAGRNPSPEFVQRVQAADGARVEADVPSMEPLLTRARLGVAPLLEGGGSRIKLLEYAAYALPSVSTFVGASGLDGLPEVAVRQTPEDAQAFCDALRAALDHGPTVLDEAVVATVLDRYGWDRALAPIADLLDVV
ncbi:GT2 family glycosyltransferase [Kineosphaera limosa]|uniref:Putative glycosyltransferase n=1 Tax=Kineosphaera limosa NBRC 100340 TaxID=1184609 RepID=K6X6B3_9MICO|nr:glycosyltransferase [Kineosphaera limosa]NYE02894.1 GT2 family glycosyltransferase [Kineosphaera limosa]GAB94324.1 putative glycosyltransferase [Kineosphaera limosa NBRC 100340]